MKIVFLRMLFLLLLIFLQLSFFNIVFPWFRAPLFLVGVITLYTLLQGFPRVLFVIVPLSLLFDIASAGSVTWLSVSAILFSYTVGFLQRRILLEQHGAGLMLSGFVAYGAALLYQSLSPWGAARETLSGSLPVSILLPSQEGLVFSFIFFFPVFLLSFRIIRSFEGFLEKMNQKQFRSIR